jgi:hypothetical protein
VTTSVALRAVGRRRVTSGRRITASLSYVTERWEGKIERAGGWSKMAKSLSEHTAELKTFFLLLISTQLVAFSFTDFYITIFCEAK